MKDLESKALEKENKKGGLASLAGAPSFKAGGQLPTLNDDNDFPPVSKPKKPGVKFDDQFDDDFSEGDAESPNEANNDDDEDEDEDDDGDFDANELLNMADY